MSGKLKPITSTSFHSTGVKQVKGVHHSVSGSQTQISVMVLDKKLINFNTNSSIRADESKKENSRKLLSKPSHSSGPAA
jgi:hypothetical protein